MISLSRQNYSGKNENNLMIKTENVRFKAVGKSRKGKVNNT